MHAVGCPAHSLFFHHVSLAVFACRSLSMSKWSASSVQYIRSLLTLLGLFPHDSRSLLARSWSVSVLCTVGVSRKPGRAMKCTHLSVPVYSSGCSIEYQSTTMSLVYRSISVCQ
jgi:hypothetical protein